jgi:tetratricopeptide (TPR) repeat protein
MKTQAGLRGRREPRGARAFVWGLVLGSLLLLTAGAGVVRAQAQDAAADVYVAQAILAYEEKRYADALAALRQALDLNPNHVDALYYTGLVHFAAERFDEAVAVLEKAQSLAPRDETVLYQLGVAYFAQGKHDRAEPLLEQAFAVKPTLENLGYYVGAIRFQRNDYQGALRAFSAGTSKDPAIQQLTRFYSGLALAQLGLPERAAAEVEEAIKLQPVSPLTGPAERLRDAIIGAREEERRFRAELRAGAFYDSNVSVVPLKSDDVIAESVRLFNKAEDRVESFGELIGLRLEYSWLRTGPWEATVGYSFFQTINNDVSSLNIQDHLAALAGFYRGVVGAMPYQLGGQYFFDYLTLGGDEFLKRHTVTAFGSLVENASNLTTVQARFQDKDFADEVTDIRFAGEDRDARNWMVGWLHTFRFARDKHLLRVGYQFDAEDARGSNFDYVGHRILAGAQYTLAWKGIRLKYDLDLHLRDYLNPHTFLPSAAPGTRERKDTEQTHVFRVELPLPYRLTLSAEFLADRARSNLAAFSYDRYVGSLILSWLY